MFELAYETFDRSLTIFISEGTLEELAQELENVNYTAFQENEGLIKGHDDGYFKIEPCRKLNDI